MSDKQILQRNHNLLQSHMTPIIFNGREFAKVKEEALKERVRVLQEKGITPTLVSIVVGDESGALGYQNMKKKAGERVGVEVEIVPFPMEMELHKLLKYLRLLKHDHRVYGIMIQLPLPKSFSKEDREELIAAIDPKKDVDGMREDSEFVAPVVKAVMEALEEGKRQIAKSKSQIAVIGANGFEGRKIVREFERLGYRVQGLDKEDMGGKGLVSHTKSADVIVSTTGVPNLITGDMVKVGAIVIDVGAPKGDVDFGSVAKKASFITPVPGGIGPVTIACLLENVVEAASKQQKDS